MLSRSRPPRFWPRATDPSRWPHANAAWSSPKTFWPMNQARSRSTPRRRRRRAARAPFSRCRWSLTAASPACSWLVIALAARSRPRRHGWRRPSPITPPWCSRTRASTKRPSGADTRPRRPNGARRFSPRPAACWRRRSTGRPRWLRWPVWSCRGSPICARSMSSRSTGASAGSPPPTSIPPTSGLLASCPTTSRSTSAPTAWPRSCARGSRSSIRT